MVITFSSRFPAEVRPKIELLCRKAGHYWGFADYELEVNLKAPRETLAEVSVVPESHRAIVRLQRSRLHDPLLERDLLHELLHIPRWSLAHARDAFLPYIAIGKRRVVARDFDKLLELDHDAAALAWLRIFPLLPEPNETTTLTYTPATTVWLRPQLPLSGPVHIYGNQTTPEGEG